MWINKKWKGNDGPIVKPKQEEEVRLSKGVFEPIDSENGYEFNKKCKVRVNVDLLNGTTDRKKVTFETFVEFDGEKEDLCQPLDGFIKDDGYAESEMMLFYGEKYYQAWQKDNTVKCKYIFKATHPKAKSPAESEVLEMPYEETSEGSNLQAAPDSFEENKIILYFENSDKNAITNIEVELSNGKKYTPGDDGNIQLDSSENADGTLSITGIKLL